ncbi:MAG: hypothetical protein WKF91_20635, partial [Segetibacter sp.]
IQTAILTELCIALDYNFFDRLSQALPANLHAKKEVPVPAEPDHLKELESLRAENIYLKQIIEVFSRK